MRIGQRSLIIFVSKIFGSLLGFISTVYFARVLGAEVLGIYSVIIALIAWLRMIGRVGLYSATVKRISEGKDQGQYFSAGLILIAIFSVMIVILILVFAMYIENYISEFDKYSSISVIWFIIFILILFNVDTLIKSALNGQKTTHIAGLLNPFKIITQSIIQITLVYLGYRLVGMLLGYGLGILIAACLGWVFVTIRPKFPNIGHFKSLLTYAKYSWLSGLKSRAYNDVDILILGAFVSQSLIGIYSVAWSISRFLDIFGLAISQTMFPEISNISAQESSESVIRLVEDSLTFAGLIVIPGFVGGIILGERLLNIYGPEFRSGVEVFWLLLTSLLFYSYLSQLLNALNAINRPDLAFRVNLIFILSNVLLNIILIWKIGWVGAAIASAASSFIGLMVCYQIITDIIDLRAPTKEISKQGISAMVMGGIVWFLQTTIEHTGLVNHNFAILLFLVAVGGVIYFSTLILISSEFRSTVNRNLPINLI